MMFEEGVQDTHAVRDEAGNVSVLFPHDHPGYHDAEYRRRRERFAEAAFDYADGQPIPDLAYTPAEDEMWRDVTARLRDLHRTYACAEYRSGLAGLDLPTDRVPQLRESSARLERRTGFRFVPAPGLVEPRAFYHAFADRRFRGTQFLRHVSAPNFSPEPDMIHEVVGHGGAMSNHRLAGMYQRIGRAARRLASDDLLLELARVFWFTLEYGLVRQDRELRTCGASLLSSIGEMQEFRSIVDVQPLDAAAMVAQKYTVDSYQPVLFCASSFGELETFIDAFIDDVLRRDAV